MMGYSERRLPGPAGVRYNDWRGVDLPPLGGFAPWLPVSVVMPYYRTAGSGAALGRTLAALEGQGYPRDLFEVVIVDDGSEPPLERPRSPLSVRVVRQERCGVGIARARNTGVRAAAHDIILFLDSDLMAESGWMAAHARWHHFVSDAVSVGFLAQARAEHLGEDAVRGREGTLGDLLPGGGGAAVNNQLYMLRTNDLTTRSDDLFRVVVGGNFGIGRDFYWEVGGHNESFVRYGLEDTEFSYRVYTRGGLFAPAREGLVWHQGRKPETDAEKRRNTRVQRGKTAHLIAHPQFRGERGRRVYAVPRYVVTIEAGDCPAEQVIEAVGNVLADRVYDLVARVEVGDGDPERLAWLRDVFGPEPRVRVAPGGDALEEFPASPFQVRLPASVTGKDLVHRLRGRLGGAAAATADWGGDGGDGAVSIARAWALHRARRSGGAPGDFGEVRRIGARRLRLRARARAGDGGAAAVTGIPGRRQYLLERARDIHSWREAWWFVRWVARWCWRRVAAG